MDLRTLTWTTLGLLALTACDSGGSGSGSEPAANCVDRCAAKVQSCGQDPQVARSFCESSICSSTPTEDQLSCAEGKTCEEIAMEDNVCGIGETDAGGSCPTLSNCACGISGVVEINGRCAMTCEEACAALEGAGG